MPSDRIFELTKSLVEARSHYLELKTAATEAEKVRKKIELELFNQMENEGYQSFTHDELGTFYQSEHLWCRISDFDKATEYMQEQGVYEDIMKLKPEHERLNAFIKKNFLEKGEPVPEGLIGISVTLTPRVGRRKGLQKI